MTIGKRIKEARKKAGLTQAQLAAKLDLATGTIQQYELGKREPRYDQLQRIADALDVSFEYLIGVESIVARDIGEKIRQASQRGDAAEVERLLGLPSGTVVPTQSMAGLMGLSGFSFNKEKISAAVMYAMREEDLMKAYRRLNDEGQQKAVERVEELTEIPKYQRTEPPPVGAEKPAEDE